jgi:hypothetical protein
MCCALQNRAKPLVNVKNQVFIKLYFFLPSVTFLSRSSAARAPILDLSATKQNRKVPSLKAIWLTNVRFPSNNRIVANLLYAVYLRLRGFA